MKKIFLLSVIPLIYAMYANAATPWWQQPTVCRLNPTNCYSAMGVGFDSGLWDTSANCWGLKMICPEALKEYSSIPVAMERSTLKKGDGINPDYDTDALSHDGECFGRRKSENNGAMVSVDGKFVNVYCPGILTTPDETFENGEIVHGTQPTCDKLATDGYVAVLNGNCYGKYYDSRDYYIDCGTALLPKRLIVLNGADYNAPAYGTPYTMTEARQKFDKMYSTSKTQHEKYFKN